MNIYVYKNEQQLGPYNEEQVLGKLSSSEFSYDDLCWLDGWNDWKPLRSLKFPPPIPLPSSIPLKPTSEPTDSKKHRKPSKPVKLFVYIFVVFLVGIYLLKNNYLNLNINNLGVPAGDLKIRGLYLGMDMQEGAKVLSDILKTDVYIVKGYPLIPHMGFKKFSSLVPYEYHQGDNFINSTDPSIFCEPDSSLVETIRIDDCESFFNCGKMSKNEFIRKFMDSYNIPKFKPVDVENVPIGFDNSYSEVVYQYRNPSGYIIEIRVNGNYVASVILKKDISDKDLKFN